MKKKKPTDLKDFGLFSKTKSDQLSFINPSMEKFNINKKKQNKPEDNYIVDWQLSNYQN